jgi:ABC-type uncharacterized transport system substrate-binding protein
VATPLGSPPWGDGLSGKRLELLREAIPHLSRLAIMGNVTNNFTALEMTQLWEAARKLGIDAITSEIRGAQDIAGAFEHLKGRLEYRSLNHSCCARIK